MASIEIIEERTDKNTEEIKKIYRCLFGANGSGGGLMAEHEVVKNNLRWIKYLLTINLSVLIGAVIRSLIMAL